MKKKPLNEQLFDEPYRFEFFQAVRLLERIYPERTPVGQGVTPNNEIVRFENHLSLSFPASAIQKIKETDDEVSEQRRLEMFVNFMGMLGVVGVLPIHYTELAMSRSRYGDHTFASFMDIFTHRAISLFVKAWEKYRFPVQYERGNDAFTEYLFDFAGLGTGGLRGRMDLNDEDLLPYTGLIAQKPHSSSALSQIISDYFGVEAKIFQFFGQWLELEEESITRIGKANYSLGVNTIVGTRVWDYQSNFRLVLGALKFTQFQAFLPNGTAYKPMLSIIKFMVGYEQDFDVQLKLKAKEV
ncbi:MAG: type VI secretion system baseplate subunit TssG, partial [Acidobacteriota bacterium]